MKKIVKSDIINNISENLQINNNKSSLIVKIIINKLKYNIMTKKKFNITKFGKFTVKKKAERIVKPFKGNKDYIIKPKNVVTFNISTIFKKRLNNKLETKKPNYSKTLEMSIYDELKALDIEISRDIIKKAVNSFFENISNELLNGNKIEIRNFGRFKTKNYKSYLGRNPKTNESILVPEKKLVTFKYSNNFFKG